jgi:hypothetical protein
MRTIRARLTYSNVISTLALFLVLCGGVAYAARVGKKSVGSSQLKANAVTTAKIKANAVTTRKLKKNSIATAKIKDGAIETEKILNGSVAESDLNMGTMPFSRIVFETRGSATAGFKEKEPLVYPLVGASYSQEAGRDDTFMGALDVNFKAACEAPREVRAYVLADATSKPTETMSPNNIVAEGRFQDEDGSLTGGRINLGPIGGLFQPATATNHTLSLVAFLNCTTGDGATATFGGVDVIGVKR